MTYRNLGTTQRSASPSFEAHPALPEGASCLAPHLEAARDLVREVETAVEILKAGARRDPGSAGQWGELSAGERFAAAVRTFAALTDQAEEINAAYTDLSRYRPREEKLARMADGAEGVRRAVETAARAAAALDDLRLVHEVADEYRDELVRRAGFESIHDAIEKREKISLERVSLQRAWLGCGRFLHRAAITNLSHEEAHLDQLVEAHRAAAHLKGEPLRFTSYGVGRLFERIKDDFVEGVLESIEESRRSIGEVRSSRTVSGPPAEIQQALQVAEIERFVGDISRDFAAPAIRREVGEIVALSFAASPRPSEGVTIARAMEAHGELRSRIDALQPSLADRVRRECDYTVSVLPKEWGRSFDWLVHHASVSDNREIERLHRTAAAKLFELVESDEYMRGEVARIVGHPALEKGAEGDFVVEFNRAVMRRVLSNPAVEAHLGRAFLDRADEVLKGEILDRLKTSWEGGKDVRVQLGWKLQDYSSADVVPYVVLNAFREPGYSGERPFRCGGGEGCVSAYLRALDASTRNEVRALGIPGLMGAIAAIEANPETFDFSEIRQSGGRFEPNPRHRELQLHLLETVGHYLASPDESDRRFAAPLLGSIDAPLSPSLTDSLEQRLSPDSDGAFRRVIVQELFRRIRYFDEGAAARLILKAVREDDGLAEKISAHDALGVLGALTGVPLAEEDARTISQISGESVADIESVHRFMSDLRQLGRPDRAPRCVWSEFAKSFASIAPAARLPGAIEACRRLREFGYVFQPVHGAVMPVLIEHCDAIARDMARIREFNPNFVYEPAENPNGAAPGQALITDAFATLVVRPSRENIIEDLARWRSIGGRFDPVLCRAVFGAWRGIDAGGAGVFGALESVPPFFTAALERFVAPVAAPEESITPLEALVLVHPFGQRAAARSEAWVEALAEIVQTAQALSSGDRACARDMVYLALDAAAAVDRRDVEPPRDTVRWSRFVMTHRVGAPDGPIYGDEANALYEQRKYREELVGAWRLLRSELADAASVDEFERLVGQDPAGLRGVVSGFIGAGSVISTPPAVLAAVGEFKAAEVKLGRSTEALFREALPVAAALGWLESPADISGVVGEIVDLAEQGLAAPETWKALAVVYSPRVMSPLLTSSVEGGGARELQIFGAFTKAFGAYSLPSLYGVFHRCMTETPFTQSERLQYGIDSTGRQGFAELKSRVLAVRRALLASDGPLEIDSVLDRELVAAQTRFHESQWGRGDQTLEGRIRSFNAGFQAGAIAPVADSFAQHRGAQYRVRRLDARAAENFTFTEDVIVKLRQLRSDIGAVHGLSLEEAAQRAKAELHAAVDSRIKDLSRELTPEERQKDPHGRRAEARRVEIGRWEGFREDLAAANNLVGLVKKVTAFEKKDDPATTPVVRRCLIRLGLEQIGGGRDLRDLAERPTSREVLGGMTEFFGGIIRSDVMRELDLTSHQSKRAGSAVSVKSLTEELARLESLGSAGSDVIELLPTRGILGELSGYLCDACWTGELDIMERYPQITPVVFIRNPGAPNERLCGAALVMKVRTAAAPGAPAEDVFVVRGFNPLQNAITQLKAGDFFDGFVDWLARVARTEGIKKILVPGGAVGGAQTNRPTIHAHLAARCANAPVVSLSDEVETRFNNYAIAHNTYLVWEDQRGAREERNSPAT